MNPTAFTLSTGVHFSDAVRYLSDGCSCPVLCLNSLGITASADPYWKMAAKLDKDM